MCAAHGLLACAELVIPNLALTLILKGTLAQTLPASSSCPPCPRADRSLECAAHCLGRQPQGVQAIMHSLVGLGVLAAVQPAALQAPQRTVNQVRGNESAMCWRRAYMRCTCTAWPTWAC